MSLIMSYIAKKSGLEVKQLQFILDLKMTGGRSVPYVGPNWDIPEVPRPEGGIFMLVVNSSSYHKEVPITIGTININIVPKAAKKGELEKDGRKWQPGSVR